MRRSSLLSGYQFPMAAEMMSMPRPTRRVVTALLLAAVCVLSVAVRLFPVARWGVVIHEFDPHFNLRVTKLLRAQGITALRNWFDDRAWHPLGRAVGPTVYPGLMAAAAALHWLLEVVLRIPVTVRHACVFLAPLFAAFACLALFALSHQTTGSARVALTAAALLSVCPAYIARSTAGSFDNEGVAIFLLVLTFFLWLCAVRHGSSMLAACAALSYFAMVISWGGYVFIINLVPLHVVALVVKGVYSPRLYVAYSTFYPLATLLAMQVPFVGFNVVTQAETAASHAVFLALQAFAFERFLRKQLPADQVSRLFRTVLSVAAAVLVLVIVSAMALGKLQWSGRSLTLLDPTYAAKYIPIVASVGEHQSTVWANFYLSLGPIVLFAPLGLYYCFDRVADPVHGEAYVFMIIYGAFSFYFAGIMVRLLLTLAPAACFLSALGISEFMTTISSMMKQPSVATTTSVDPPPTTVQSQSSAKMRKMKKINTNTSGGNGSMALTSSTAALAAAALEQQHDREGTSLFSAFLAKLTFSSSPANAPTENPVGEAVATKRARYPAPQGVSLLLLAAAFLLITHSRHCVKVSQIAFSSTAMVVESRHVHTHEHMVHDDYREAYHWLRMNTAENATVLSWWDYGYQLSSLANRTVIVDNNTWNNTHIATVGRVLASSEQVATPILESLGVDYVLIVFGGRIGMRGDDLNKLPWMLRIAAGVFPDAVLESEFKSESGRFSVQAASATPAMTQSLLYKMSYFGFYPEPEEVVDASTTSTSEEPPEGQSSEAPLTMDYNRNEKINASSVTLTHFEEAFTSAGWIVRIFRVKKSLY